MRLALKVKAATAGKYKKLDNANLHEFPNKFSNTLLAMHNVEASLNNHRQTDHVDYYLNPLTSFPLVGNSVWNNTSHLYQFRGDFRSG